jgi:hypothetical protein
MMPAITHEFSDGHLVKRGNQAAHVWWAEASFVSYRYAARSSLGLVFL